jgi:hypothetical protein
MVSCTNFKSWSHNVFEIEKIIFSHEISYSSDIKFQEIPILPLRISVNEKRMTSPKSKLKMLKSLKKIRLGKILIEIKVVFKYFSHLVTKKCSTF